MRKSVGFVLRNLVRMLSLLVCTSIATFALVSLSPVNPLQANVGQVALGSMSREQIERLEAYWGVGEPPARRFLAWAGDFIRGDMGVSLKYRQSVKQVIFERLQNSLWLMAFAWLASGLAGFALGVFAGANKGGIADKAIRAYSLLTASTPTFWLALVFLIIFGVWLKIFPVGLSVPVGVEASAVTVWDRLRHAALPALTLSVAGVGNIALHTREKMAAVMESDYVLFARARGNGTPGIALRHGIRGALIPALTLQFASIGEIFGGSMLVEQIFSYPGLGQAAVAAGLGGDVPLLLGIAVISAAIVFLGNFTANVLYGAADPRIRRGAASK